MEVLTLPDGAKTKPSPLYPRGPVVAQDAARREIQAQFCRAYEETGTITHAARAVGLSRQAHYDWIADPDDDEYKRLWAEAQEGFIEWLEREAARRAAEGYEVGQYYQGTKVGVERRYSDYLLMFLLKGRRPEVYKDRQELTGPGGGPVQVQAVRSDALARLPAEALEALRMLNQRVAPALSPPIDVEPIRENAEYSITSPRAGDPVDTGGLSPLGESGEAGQEPGEAPDL